MAGYRRGTREEMKMRKKLRKGKEPKKTEVTMYWRTELRKNGRSSEESTKTLKHDILDCELEDWLNNEIYKTCSVVDRMNDSDEANYTSTTIIIYKSKKTDSTVITVNNLKEFEKNDKKYEKTFHKSYHIDKLLDL